MLYPCGNTMGGMHCVSLWLEKVHVQRAICICNVAVEFAWHSIAERCSVSSWASRATASVRCSRRRRSKDQYRDIVRMLGRPDCYINTVINIGFCWCACMGHIGITRTLDIVADIHAQFNSIQLICIIFSVSSLCQVTFGELSRFTFSAIVCYDSNIWIMIIVEFSLSLSVCLSIFLIVLHTNAFDSCNLSSVIQHPSASI